MKRIVSNLKWFIALATLVLFTLNLTPTPIARADNPQADPDAMVMSDGRVVHAPNATEPFTLAYAGSAADTRKTNSAESIIGKDNRSAVTNETKKPYRAIALVSVQHSDMLYYCTGFFISKDTVATTAACANPLTYGAVIRVYPGFYDYQQPYGDAEAIVAFVPAGWLTNMNPKYNYGALKLDKPLGNTVGWFGMTYSGDASFFQDRQVALTGYGNDSNFPIIASQWKMIGSINGVTPRKLYYKHDTDLHTFGAPLYARIGSCRPCAIGIHSADKGLKPYPKMNSGIRFTQKVYDSLVAFTKQ